MASKKDTKELLKEAEGQGWRIEKTKGGHWRVFSPDGAGIVYVASTPSDHRGFKNTIAKMRQYGFKWKGR